MSNVEKMLLTGSTNGKPVLVVATASTGTTIHQAVSGTTNLDEIWLWAVNLDTVNRTLNLQWGDTARIRKFILEPSVETLIAPGWLLQNSLLVTAFTPSAANLIEIIGHVHRIT